MRGLRVPRPDRRVLALVLLIGLAINQLRITVGGAGKFILEYPGFSDFGSYYLYAQVGLHQGWNHLYDLAAQRQEWFRYGGPDVIPWFPMIYPPPLAWLVVPFTVLPLPVALGCWMALLVGLTLIAWRLVAPGRSRLARWTALAAMLAVFPVAYGIILGQVLILELAAIAAAWWFLARGREIPAGFLLLALVFKPQVAILLPVVLLLVGRWRTLLVWGAGLALMAAVAVATTGLSGLHEYAIRLFSAAAGEPQFLVPTQFTLAGTLGHGLATIVVSATVALAAIAAAWRQRTSGIAVPVACALIGSMLVTPYLHWQDLATLLLAGAIALHGPLDRWSRLILAAGYAVLLASFYWGAGFIGLLLLASEAAFLLVVLVRPMSGRSARAAETLREVPLDRAA
jgi:Glycosyltransferase family 87